VVGLSVPARLLRASLPLFLLWGCQRSADLSPETTGTVRVLAYNIHHGEGMDEVTDLDRIAALIRAADPDIVTLQEVDSVTDRTGRIDQAAVLAERTGMHHAFGRFMPYQGGAYGMAVLSRWPIREAMNWRLTDGEEPRTALGVRVQPPGTDEELLVVGIHFYRTAEERLAQATDLEEILRAETSPVILAGDFNSTPGSEVMAYLGASWTILDKGDDRFTFPSYAPEREIDFVLTRPRNRLAPVEHRPLREPLLSDHRPLWAELDLGPSDAPGS